VHGLGSMTFGLGLFGKLSRRRGAWGLGSMTFGRGLFGKLLRRRGAWAWFHDIWSWSLWKALDEEGCMGLVP